MAAATYFDQVQKLYIAYFGRPADPTGLNYWAANIDAAGGNVDGIIAGFAASTESQALYAAGNTPQLVTSIYVALFNRTPEPAGLAYWVAQIDAGTISGARAAYQILTSAGPGDAVAIANKVTAATAFTANIDTSAELAGYSGASAAAVARAFLSQVDATSYSVGNLSSTVAQAVANATGTQVATPTPAPAAPTFSATKDGSNVVTFSNAGTAISATEAGGTWTFTNTGTYAGTATVTGTVAGITVPAASTLTLSSTLATGKTFAGTGTVALSDTGLIIASTLKGIEAATTGLLDASTVGAIASASVADAVLLLDTKKGTSGDAIKVAANVVVGLTDISASAADLKIIDGATTGLVNASNLNTLSGTTADVKAVLEAVTGGTAISANSLNKVELSTAITANTLDSVVFANNATIQLADVAGNTLTTVNATVGSGKTLTIDGSGLTGAHALTFDGSQETNGSFVVKGGTGNDTITVGQGVHSLTGGGGTDTFGFTASASLIGNGAGTNITKISDFNTAGADSLVFSAVAILRGADLSPAASGSNVEQSSGGLITFDSPDNTLALKLVSLQADAELKVANSVAFFEDNGNTYVFFSGATTAASDDQLIELTGVTGLTTLSAGSSVSIS